MNQCIVKSLTENTTENTTEKKLPTNTHSNNTLHEPPQTDIQACENNDITPFNILNFYRENISREFSKIREQKSFNLLALKADSLQEILVGLKNYAEHIKLKRLESRYITALNNFIQDKIYLDYQKEIKDEWTTHGQEQAENLEWR